MGRVYEVPINNMTLNSTAGAQDLFSIQATSGMAFKLLEVVLGQTSITTIETLRLSFKRLSGTITIGTGGPGTITPVPHNFNDKAATVVARIGDSTPASATGSTIIRADTFNEVNGYQYLAIPDKEIIIAPAQALIVSLDSILSGTRVLNGSLTLEELF